MLVVIIILFSFLILEYIFVFSSLSLSSLSILITTNLRFLFHRIFIIVQQAPPTHPRLRNIVQQARLTHPHLRNIAQRALHTHLRVQRIGKLNCRDCFAFVILVCLWWTTYHDFSSSYIPFNLAQQVRRIHHHLLSTHQLAPSIVLPVRHTVLQALSIVLLVPNIHQQIINNNKKIRHGYKNPFKIDKMWTDDILF